MNRRSISTCVIGACCALTFAACETEEPPGGRPGTAKYRWMSAIDYQNRSQFSKMVGEIQALVDRRDEYQASAVIWRTAVLHGLCQGLMKVGDAYRAVLEREEELNADYQSALQQGNRNARTFAIQLAESLGEVERLLEGETLTLEFPFPEGEHAPSPVVQQIADSQPVERREVVAVTIHEQNRGMVLAATQLAGEEDPEKARAKFEAGPVQVSTTDAKFRVATMLLDTGLLFSKARLYDPRIRNIFVNAAEKLIEPFAESEDNELKARAEEFAKEVDDERLDIAGKARLLEKRE